MKFKVILSILITYSLNQFALGQSETYTLKKASFSSDLYDEFSPVFYKNGIVFCTNRDRSLSSHSTFQNKGLFNINYVDTTNKANWQNARLLSKNLTTKLNDGPATFNSTGDTIYFSRNLEVNSNLRDILSPRNKLGLFSAILVGEEWTKVRELRINNEWYNVITPWLSPEGKRLFFASDKPGGFGGSDLYFSYWKGDYWDDPINLGPVINTKGNETYPFINPAGELFFSSDGHPGFGGKDIFYSRLEDTSWIAPVQLDAPVNSKYNDFGIITDSLLNEGYFSSDRDKTIDIFHFKTNSPQIFYTKVQKANNYCFIFSDGEAIVVDTLFLKYTWDFGDGKKTSGRVVNHCLPGPGIYSVKLDIIDRSTGNLFFSKLAYKLDLRDYVQPYINSPDASVPGELIDFNGLKSYLPGYKILNYLWDFGDGSRIEGESVKHAFKEKGVFQVNLGLTLKSDSTGIIHKTGVTKKIVIMNDQKERVAFLAKNSSIKPELSEIGKYSNAYINTLYSAEAEFKLDAVFQVELISSKTKIGLNANVFRNVPKKYEVKEAHNQESGTYSYFIDEQLNLMATYFTYKEITGYGFKDARIRIEILKDPPEKELNNLKRIFGILTDSYFDNNNRLTSNAYLLLDQIVKIMNKYPGLRLEIDVHTDNTGSVESKLLLSQNYAQIISNYLINKGIESRKVIAKGFGGSRPVAPNFLAKDRSLNRRIDFTIVRE